MAYSTEIYEEAYRVLEKRRDNNKYIIEKRKEEIKHKIPEYAKLKSDLMDIIGGYISGLEKGKGAESIDDTKKAVGQNEQKRRQLLKENGYPEDYLDDIYKCSLCKDTGSIGEKRCECFKTLLIKIACAKSNVDFSLSEYDFDKFDLKLFSCYYYDGN